MRDNPAGAVTLHAGIFLALAQRAYLITAGMS
jgi:hypothetical protein